MRRRAYHEAEGAVVAGAVVSEAGERGNRPEKKKYSKYKDREKEKGTRKGRH